MIKSIKHSSNTNFILGPIFMTRLEFPDYVIITSMPFANIMPAKTERDPRLMF